MFNKLKGFFSAPYEIRVPDGDSSKYFGNYVGQRYGTYDTQTCWEYALCEITETQLELEKALGRFSDEDLAWFQEKGFIDEDGDFYLSRRFGAILSGRKDEGNDEASGWELAAMVGMIPFSMLPYSISDAADEDTRLAFVDEYFDSKVITKEMSEIGQGFLDRVDIKSEELGTRWTKRTPDDFIKALKQGPLQIGIPVPQNGLWNREFVDYDGGKVPAHSVELYKYVANDPYPYFIFDSYEPHCKRLSAGYYIPLITRAVVTAKKNEPMLSSKLSLKVWIQFVEILRKIGILR